MARRIGRVVAWLVVLAGLGALGYHYRDRFPGLSGPKVDTGPLTVAVAQGPLVISVRESGTIKPSELTVIKNMLEGRSTILFLAPEGERVSKGDLLVELDATKLSDERVEQEIRVRNAQASLIQSEENLAVVRNKAKADMEKAQLTLEFAREDLKNYQEGEFPNQKKELEGKITLALEEVQRSTEKLAWSRQLFEEKYLSETELQADELAAKKSALDLELARNRLQLLEEYTYKRQIDKLSSDVTQAEMAYERMERSTAADVRQAEATLEARQLETKRQEEKLVKIDEQIGKAKIVAPTDGILVYATSTQISWRGSNEPLAEGQEVHERQELIHLPVADTFTAVVKIHESSLKKIYPGLPVRITVSALPGRELMGKVTKIAPLPDPQSMFMNPDLKLFTTEVAIEGGGDVLRTGMTCEVDIVVEKHDNAMSLPVQCVVREGGRPVVYVMEGTNQVPKPVEIGLDNNQVVHILSGLSPGEEVLLTPPLGAASAADHTAAMGDVEIPDRPLPGTRNGGGGPTAPVGPRPGEGPGDAGAENIPARPAAGDAAAGRPPRQDGGENGAGAGGPQPPAGAEAGEGGGRGPRRGQRPPMTPEQMQQMRERFEKMTPEEREAARKQFEDRRRQGRQGEGGGE
ncbi:MAG: efflux RND transporter periplasmic adaptor subunit [Lentisphaeria bacterium]|nr:efflux RND transporter periplasmic adaptor subunit [Lentisphaeria bacterium]